MVIFKLIIFGIPLLSLAWWWWADRQIRNAGKAPRIALALAMLALLGGYVWVLLGRREVVTLDVPPPLYALVLLWGIIFLPFVAIPMMVVGSLWAGIRRIFKIPARSAEHAGGPWTRRRWLAAAASFPVLATYATAALSLPRMARFRVREITIPLAGLPAALDGLRIAHLTDTHVGKFTRGRVLDEIVTITNALQADLVLFTGDLIDNTIRDLPAAVAMMQQLRAKSGVFIVEGNHDLFDDPAGFENGLRAGGLAMLRNEAVTVQVRGAAVQVMGIVWNRSETEMARNIDAVASLRDPAAFPILLAHHPHAFDRAEELGIPLTLAGHTHGGQLMLTQEIGPGPTMFRYWSGLYQKAAGALIVGNGTGNWFPLRVNAPAEIVHLTLRRA